MWFCALYSYGCKKLEKGSLDTNKKIKTKSADWIERQREKKVYLDGDRR